MKPHPQNILSAWTAFEVLSPPTFKNAADLAATYNGELRPLDQPLLPWEEPAAPTSGYRFYYHVVLGTVSYEGAIIALLEKYADERPEKPRLQGEVILAAMVLDDQGKFAGLEPIALSSFGWGFPVALKGDLRALAGWSGVEKELTQEVRNRLERTDQQGTLLPVGRAGLLKARDYLLNALAIPVPFVTSNAFAIRCTASVRAATVADPLLLNSFYLGDMAWARRLFTEGKAPLNLQRYMGIRSPGARQNLLGDATALDSLLAPSRFSPARWPGPGRHPLVLLQQAAVNAALEATPKDSIMAVNGPPGTGKTTLLRDVVAGILTQRAEALCSFKHPKDAFTFSGEQISVGAGFLRLHQLDKRIKGHELLIASSNNKAVENVSAELPGLGAIADDASDLRYFKCLSDSLLGRESWGLIAAVLGNASNRFIFSKTFWWDTEVGLSTYLAEAAGTPQWVDEIDPATRQVTCKRKPRIVTEAGAPISSQEAFDRWQLAKKQFQEALADSRAQLRRLETIRKWLLEMPVRQEAVATATRVLAVRQQEQLDARQALASDQERVERLIIALDLLDVELHAHKLQRPGFWARLFQTRIFRGWLGAQKALTTQWLAARREQLEQAQEVNERTKLLSHSETAVQQANQHLATARQRLQALEESLEQARIELPGTWLDPAFYRQSYESRHLSAPWCDTESHRLRDNVFVRAMELHKAFIDAAALPLKHNLGALLYVFARGTLPDDAKMALLPDLWSSLFLVVPALSTTFSSVERLLGKLPPASLGWLLVDEAGQALPQAAVGAMLRTQRAVVVGDPLQVEPVVVLPDQLTSTLCRHFNIEPLRYNPPKASVQTLADAATPYYAEFESINGARAVGVPLLVHRRCEDPMFSISNIIAYARLMVSAKAPRASAIRELLGPSQWIDVQGTAEEKWSPEEGQVVLQLLARLKAAGVSPDIYIVTPFTIVADRLRTLIRQSRILEKWVPQPEQWPYERVGTVHTVQGREAEAVIFVLGAQAADKEGSRVWAGKTANLLNVAVTRAKEALYVVGNRKLWEGTGVFQRLAERM